MSLISLSIFLNLFEEFVCKYYLFKINFIHAIFLSFLLICFSGFQFTGTEVCKLVYSSFR